MIPFLELLLDVNRLLKEVKEKDQKIEDLERQLEQRQHYTDFCQVSQRFELEGVKEIVLERVIEDFKPVLKGECLKLLETAFRSDMSDRPVYFDVAFEQKSRSYNLRFYFPQMQTNISVHEHAMKNS